MKLCDVCDVYDVWPSRGAATATLGCIQNLTEKVAGDDAEHIMDVFEPFLEEKAKASTPFLAVLWLHSIHEPHPAMPEYFYAYKDAFGQSAGDYLGTITQADVQIGRLRALLRANNVADNTMLWYTTDNGPNPRNLQGAYHARDLNFHPSLSATNGLRQCKQSLYEGGIRVPGILEWPGGISKRADTWHPAYVSDYLPTFLDLVGLQHPHPTWAADGISLLPLITKLGAAGAVNDTTLRSAAHPLVFKLADQVAVIDNDWKILSNPAVGICAKLGGGVFRGTRLYNLGLDPTESTDVSTENAGRFQNMSRYLAAFTSSIGVSATTESECSASIYHSRSAAMPQATEGGILPGCRSPFAPKPGPKPPIPPPGPRPGPPPGPLPPSGSTFTLAAPGNGGCLTATVAAATANASLAPCTMGNRLQAWQINSDGMVFLAGAASGGDSLCIKTVRPSSCTPREAVWLGEICVKPHGFALDGNTLRLFYNCESPMCLGHGANIGMGRSGALGLRPCSDLASSGWVRSSLLWRGSWAGPG